MNKYIVPLKREVWEHHGSFIRMPIIVVIILNALLFVMALAAVKNLSDSSFLNINFSEFSQLSFDGDQSDIRHFEYNDTVVGEAESVPSFDTKDRGELRSGLKMTLQSPYILFHGILLLVAFSYLLSCLIADRKDNSILFWKSMPVSESQNVINKVLVVTFLLPAIAWAAAFATSIAIIVITLILALWSGIDGLAAAIFQESSILATGFSYIGTYLAVSLWMLPVTAWFLCASAAAKKNVFLTAVLPIILLVVVEKYLLDSHNFGTVFFQHMSGLITGEGNPFMIINPAGWAQLGSVISSGQFWLVMPFAAALTYAAIWLRENRYEGSL